MLVMTLIYDSKKGDLYKELKSLKDRFRKRKILLGLSESLISNYNSIKIFIDDNDLNERVKNLFFYEISELIYNRLINHFYDENLEDFINENYFFLKYDEIIEVKSNCFHALKCQEEIFDEEIIYCLNKKNNVIQKITKCLMENEEINVDGYITFRINDLKGDLIAITDKTIEKFMVSKEYNEFIKLLKYFVEIQESKIDELNIIIKKNGDYVVCDENKNNIMLELINEIYEPKYNGIVNVEDMIISGLITNSPRKIIIHNFKYCNNKEFIETIKNVFENRVSFCEECELCVLNTNPVKI
ncbi:MAG: putative sporulation protein YtxC [Clostridiaceae bacterium]